MSITYWRLDAGGKDGQELRKEKLKEGKKYIEKLKKDFKITKVEETENYLKIFKEKNG